MLTIYIVGDIVMQNDHSISRNHAILKVDEATKRSVVSDLGIAARVITDVMLVVQQKVQTLHSP